MSSGLKELKLWQEAVALGADVVRLGRSAAKRETKVVTDRLMAASVDAATRIAVGYTHPAPPAQLGYYVQARASLVEVETILAIGRQAGVVPADAVLAASARAGTVHRLLAGYVAFLERQLVADPADAPRTPTGTPPSPATQPATPRADGVSLEVN